jgi:HupE / UreJ protein
LTALGLWRDDIPLALLMFNVGVEIGQLAFVALILTNNERPLRERQRVRLWLILHAATL